MLKNYKVSIDLRIVCVLLIVLLGVLFFVRIPGQSSSTRTITVNGEATSKEEPDEFVFTPMYQQKGIDRAAVQQELIAKINGIVAKLKELGVEESDISLASSTYDNYYNDGTSEVTSNSLTITLNNKELSQTVQDYLVTTAPEGQLSPYASFSEEKRKLVEEQVRTEAIADAKKKAEKTAEELGGKLGKVVSISDNQGGSVMPYAMREGAVSIDSASPEVASSLAILPGKQSISYIVEVIYEIK